MELMRKVETSFCLLTHVRSPRVPSLCGQSPTKKSLILEESPFHLKENSEFQLFTLTLVSLRLKSQTHFIKSLIS